MTEDTPWSKSDAGNTAKDEPGRAVTCRHLLFISPTNNFQQLNAGLLEGYLNQILTAAVLWCLIRWENGDCPAGHGTIVHQVLESYFWQRPAIGYWLPSSSRGQKIGFQKQLYWIYTKCTVIKRKEKEAGGGGKERGGERRKPASTWVCSTPSNNSSVVIPLVILPSFCLSWKDPINASAPSNSRPSPWMAPIRAQGKSND